MATFSLEYGRDETNLGGWQRLCDDCGVQRRASIKQCKAALRAVAVNIWDLIQARRTGDLPAPRYTSKAELRRDLADPSRRFPLARLKTMQENKLLRALLVTLA
ncbi:hypothetical protein BAUCODRAFT_152335 [Baudoinia panamericana UAMH 10762]|uniref:Uncharacterized protein n=1 Tax=Baudoinia panamericana (strain UAMH 10762) TaxID=717646 RepID=M2M5U6_BAUPA|nr:uncharacterized protein BAUCODRAFT_152335 [Baudoinia panamericana UAMH 10762]EMC91996.1 hypothetical protein BAUCODRAFT_152335 [Baudoinia panamericana UAMH 10762]